MAVAKSFKDLLVWQKAMELVKLCYLITEQLPKHEMYALADQVKRAAVSIPSNIAEGSKRHNSKEFHHFCGIAQGSAAELETQLILISDLHENIVTDDALALLSEVQRMLTRLSQSLRLKTNH
jgi:four helix bundle protein